MKVIKVKHQYEVQRAVENALGTGWEFEQIDCNSPDLQPVAYRPIWGEKPTTEEVTIFGETKTIQKRTLYMKGSEQCHVRIIKQVRNIKIQIY